MALLITVRRFIVAAALVAVAAAFSLISLEIVVRVFDILPAPVRQYQYHATKGYELWPGHEEINSMGMRDREYDAAKAPGTFRILAIGDSFTFGDGVERDETYPKYLESMLNEEVRGHPRFEVLNARVPGYNTFQEAIHLRVLRSRCHPDLVIVAFNLNDATSASFGLADPAAGGVLLRIKEWLEGHARLYGFLRVRIERLMQRAEAAEAGVALRSTSILPLSRAARGETSQSWEVCREGLREIGRLAREEDSPVVLMIVPHLGSLGPSYPFAAEHALVREAATDAGIAVLDLLPIFSGLEPSTLWVSAKDSHPNALAQRMAAQAVRDFLSAGAMVPGIGAGREPSSPP